MWHGEHTKQSLIFLLRGKVMESRSLKRIKIAVLIIFAAVTLAGPAFIFDNLPESSVSAQAASEAPPPLLASLKTLPVPKPSNLGDFIKNEEAAIALGKALFWDMQVGSDGIVACASCHFNAGADSRTINQISPGLLRVDTPDANFKAGGPNYHLKAADYPFHKLTKVDDRKSDVVSDSNDVASSQGMFKFLFSDIVPSEVMDAGKFEMDTIFNVGGINVRRVEPRNAPTVINAVFNFRNLWDGRAQHIFNGVNPFGERDPNAKVVKAQLTESNNKKNKNNKKNENDGDDNKDDDKEPRLTQVRINLDNSSLASQAVGPPVDDAEMSFRDRSFRMLGKKMLALRPLAQQFVHKEDSVLGALSRSPNNKGLTPTKYQAMTQAAFKDEWWSSDMIVKVMTRRTVDDDDDSNDDEEEEEKDEIVRDEKNDLILKFKKPRENGNRSVNEFTLTEYNFALFMGIAVQMYESTLVSDDTPLDRFMEGNVNALTAQQRKGLDIFQNQSTVGKAGRCIQCHSGPALTNASVANVANQRLKRMIMGNNQEAVYDSGFYNIGVRPTGEDLGVGGKDPFGQPLSESRLASVGLFEHLLGKAPNLTVASGERVAADGAFKTPGLRNVELTAPYFHNGGQLTLLQVVEFYNRGGDFFEQNLDNIDPNIRNLGLTQGSNSDREALIAFLKALTDERVRYHRAPFDHPQLDVPNGYIGDHTGIQNNGTGQGKENLLKIPAVGRGGVRTPLPTFEANLAASP